MTQNLQYNISLLRRSPFKCPSCECHCHLDTETLNGKEKNSGGISNSSSETLKNLNATELNVNAANMDNDLEKLNIEEESCADSSSQPFQVNTESSKVCDTIKDSPAKLKVDSTGVKDGGLKSQLKGKSLCKECARKCAQQHHTISGRGNPCMKFVWNKHLLRDVDTILHSDWLLYITHGFIGQCSILLSTVMPCLPP